MEPLVVALRVNAALTVRFERGFDAGFFLGRARRRFIFDGLDDVPARREFAELRRNVFAVPGHDSGATRARLTLWICNGNGNPQPA